MSLTKEDIAALAEMIKQVTKETVLEMQEEIKIASKTTKKRATKKKTTAKKKTTPSKKAVVNEDFSVEMPQKIHKKPIQAGQNAWVDTGEEKEENTDYIQTITPRNRQPAKKVKIKCVICGKEDSISSAFGFSKYSYRCNSCAGS